MTQNDVQKAVDIVLENIAEHIIEHTLYYHIEPDEIEVDLFFDSITNELKKCQTLDDVNNIMNWTDAIANKKISNTTFFEILHDAAAMVIINLVNSCEVIETYGWEAFM